MEWWIVDDCYFFVELFVEAYQSLDQSLYRRSSVGRVSVLCEERDLFKVGVHFELETSRFCSSCFLLAWVFGRSVTCRFQVWCSSCDCLLCCQLELELDCCVVGVCRQLDEEALELAECLFSCHVLLVHALSCFSQSVCFHLCSCLQLCSLLLHAVSRLSAVHVFCWVWVF